MNYQIFKTSDSEFLKMAFDVRRKVFIEEQNVAEYEEFDQFEEESIHFIAFEGNEGVATARLRETENGIKLERFAVLKEYRGKGIGNEILRMTLKEASSYKRKIYLHAQVTAVNFYEKNGFIKTGNKFTECEILHYNMYYENVRNN